MSSPDVLRVRAKVQLIPSDELEALEPAWVRRCWSMAAARLRDLQACLHHEEQQRVDNLGDIRLFVEAAALGSLSAAGRIVDR